MLVVNTNVSALKAQRELSRTRFGLSEAMERISSGVRLNSSRDDATGVGISQRMTSHIKGLSMAMQNANDGIGFLQTAEGALQEVTNLMQRMREMAVQATNEANNSTDIASLQFQVVELNAEINRIAEQTELNGKRLLNGDVVNAEFQVGIRADQVIRVSIGSTSASRIGNYSTSTNSIGAFAIGSAVLGTVQGTAPANAVRDQTISIRGFNSGASATELLIGFEETARSIAARINLEESRSGVSATAKTRLILEDVFNDEVGNDVQTISFDLYGENKKSLDIEQVTAVHITASIKRLDAQGKLDLSEFVSAINEKTIITGVSAFEVSPGKIELVQENGENISIEKFQNASGDPLRDPLPEDTLTVTGFEGTAPVTVREGTDEDSVTVGGIVTLNSYKAFTVTSDAQLQEDSLFQDGFDNFLQGAEFSSLADVDFKRVGGSNQALQIITSGLDFISSLRGELGALQNRFESTIANLGSVRENAEAARSRVQDADFAVETAKLTKSQILQEAGIAILAQANTIPQAVLALLRA